MMQRLWYREPIGGKEFELTECKRPLLLADLVRILREHPDYDGLKKNDCWEKVKEYLKYSLNHYSTEFGDGSRAIEAARTERNKIENEEGGDRDMARSKGAKVKSMAVGHLRTQPTDAKGYMKSLIRRIRQNASQRGDGMLVMLTRKELKDQNFNIDAMEKLFGVSYPEWPEMIKKDSDILVFWPTGYNPVFGGFESAELESEHGVAVEAGGDEGNAQEEAPASEGVQTAVDESAPVDEAAAEEEVAPAVEDDISEEASSEESETLDVSSMEEGTSEDEGASDEVKAVEEEAAAAEEEVAVEEETVAEEVSEEESEEEETGESDAAFSALDYAALVGSRARRKNMINLQMTGPVTHVEMKHAKEMTFVSIECGQVSFEIDVDDAIDSTMDEYDGYRIWQFSIDGEKAMVAFKISDPTANISSRKDEKGSEVAITVADGRTLFSFNIFDRQGFSLATTDESTTFLANLAEKKVDIRVQVCPGIDTDASA